jgi:hypothetical protein
MLFAIYPEVSFTKHFFVFDSGSVYISKTKPSIDLVFGWKELETISKLFLVDLPQWPPENYLKAFRGLLKRTSIRSVPWTKCLTTDCFINSIKSFVVDLGNTLQSLNLGYLEIYKQSNLVLESLKPAKVSVENYRNNRDESSTSSFCPDLDDFADPVVYDRLDSVTGRLRVVVGPNILVLKKELRPKLLRSRFGDNGTIFEIDYKSIEPRVLLALSNPEQEMPVDIYQFIFDSFFSNSDLTRDNIKDIVISKTYGSGLDSISSRYKHIKNIELVIQAIDDFFLLTKFKNKLVLEHDKNERKFITNYYGRRIATSSAEPYMFPNYFTQSTAVDVALLGFSNMVNNIENKDLIVPIFVNHDALFLDVHNSQYNRMPILCGYCSRGIPGFENVMFPVKCKNILG